MSKRNCPVCGGRQSKAIKQIRMKIPSDYRLPETYGVAACENCGFVYADTSASKEDYDWYYAHCNFYGDDSKDDNSERYEMTEELLERFFQKDSKLLELGAGNGRFEVALKRNGYTDVTGTDPSAESVARLLNEGSRAYAASIYDEVHKEEMGKYDGIFLFEVAEHLLFPGKGVENAAKMLKKDGVFIISVPDYSQIGADKSPVANYFNLEHINYFSEKSLNSLLARFGMERVAQKRYGVDLVQAYRKTGSVGPMEKDTATETAVCEYFGQKREQEERVKALIAELRAAKTELFVWGTGSYVMSLFATTDLGQCNIKGFLDNNKIKQGREMFGLPIYPPSYLKEEGAAVLVCSMLNGECIKEQIEKMHSEVCVFLA